MPSPDLLLPGSADDSQFWERCARRGLRQVFLKGLEYLHHEGRSTSEWKGEVEGILVSAGRLGWLPALAEHPAGWDRQAPPPSIWADIVPAMAKSPPANRRIWTSHLTHWLGTESFSNPRHGNLLLACWEDAEVPEWVDAIVGSFKPEDLNQPLGNSDWSPLLWAVSRGQVKTVEGLLARGAQPDWRDHRGLSAPYLILDHWKRWVNDPLRTCPSPEAVVSVSVGLEQALAPWMHPAPEKRPYDNLLPDQYWQAQAERITGGWALQSQKPWLESLGMAWLTRHARPASAHRMRL